MCHDVDHLKLTLKCKRQSQVADHKKQNKTETKTPVG